MDAKKFPRIEYPKVVDEYENRLGSMERGFALDEEFLDLWVPDEDANKSIFGIFESASIRKQKGLTVVINSAAMTTIDGEGLINSLAPLGKASVEKTSAAVTITVEFGAKGDQASAAVDDLRGLSAVHLAYRDNLVRESRTLTNKIASATDIKKSTSGAGKYELLEVPFEAGTVIFSLETTSGIIQGLYFKGLDDNDVSTRMIEILSRQVKGFSMQELAEHGAIRVENVLRDITKPGPVRGLITPENAGKYFTQLNQFNRLAYKKAVEKFGIKFHRNTSEVPVTEQWLNMPVEQRMEKITVETKKFLKEHNLAHVNFTVLGVLAEIQAYIDFEGVTGERERRFIVKNLERQIKESLEGRLEVYLPTAEDKLRRNKKSSLFKGETGTIVKKEASSDSQGVVQ